MAEIPVSATSFEEYEADLPDVDPAAAALATIHDSIFDGEVMGGVYEGRPPGIRLLGITNRRLILLESNTKEGQLALTSVPMARVTSVSYLAGKPTSDPDRSGIDRARTVAIKVLYQLYELHCEDAETAREVHDQLTWGLISG